MKNNIPERELRDFAKVKKTKRLARKADLTRLQDDEDREEMENALHDFSEKESF